MDCQPRAQEHRVDGLLDLEQRQRGQLLHDRDGRQGRSRRRTSRKRSPAARPRSAATSRPTSANQLATVLKYGALPFPLKFLSDSDIPATLGQSFLNETLLAGGIGIGLVLLFMLVYYRLPGVVACLALVYYGLTVLALFRIVPVTLTLAGIAAFVLSVGMAVDANILIFERTKEELRAGKTLVSAIEAGFNRAWNSIFDSNVSSLITASILYFLGIGHDQGLCPGPDHRRGNVLVHGHHRLAHPAADHRQAELRREGLAVRRDGRGVPGSGPARSVSQGGPRSCLTSSGSGTGSSSSRA